jgi:3-oxoacyl-[acyl-carrier-protein] synthase III
MSRVRAAIKRIAHHLPDYVLSNAELAREFEGWDEAKIFDKTGISARRVAAAGECASDLGVKAAQKLFETGACRPDEIDFLILCTQSPDYFLPATACVMQHRLGLKTGCGAIDVNQGCSGFVYGLAVAAGLISAGIVRNVLLVTADTYTKFINKRDRAARAIFGDGSAATLIAPVHADDDPIGPFVLGSDGSGARHLMVPAGCLRNPPSPEAFVETKDDNGNWRSPSNFYMNGPEVFTFTLSAVPAVVNQLLIDSNLSFDDVDYFVFHQANRFMLERLRAKLEIPPEKFALDVSDTGNTVSSSIPIALERLTARGLVRSGKRVMLVGFGVGYSWAAAMIRTT